MSSGHVPGKDHKQLAGTYGGLQSKVFHNSEHLVVSYIGVSIIGTGTRKQLHFRRQILQLLNLSSHERKRRIQRDEEEGVEPDWLLKS